MLQPFYEASTKLSGVYYPTTPLLMGELFLMCSKLNEYENLPIWVPIIADMQKTFLKYQELPPIFFMCHRFKSNVKR